MSQPIANTKAMAEISKRILTHIEQGKTVREAIDAVIGAGAAEKLIGDLYETLRADRLKR